MRKNLIIILIFKHRQIFCLFIFDVTQKVLIPVILMVKLLARSKTSIKNI